MKCYTLQVLRDLQLSFAMCTIYYDCPALAIGFGHFARDSPNLGH